MCPEIPRCLSRTDSPPFTLALAAGLLRGAVGKPDVASRSGPWVPLASLSSLPGWTHPVQIGLSFLVPVELFLFLFFFCFPLLFFFFFLYLLVY